MPAGCVTSNGTVLKLNGTTCGFAKNVYAKAHDFEDHGVWGAVSPKTGKTYFFSCDQDTHVPGVYVTCTGGGGTDEHFMAPGTSVSWLN